MVKVSVVSVGVVKCKENSDWVENQSGHAVPLVYWDIIRQSASPKSGPPGNCQMRQDTHTNGSQKETLCTLLYWQQLLNLLKAVIVFFQSPFRVRLRQNMGKAESTQT